jgi:hypothetical protein
MRGPLLAHRLVFAPRGRLGSLDISARVSDDGRVDIVVRLHGGRGGGPSGPSAELSSRRRRGAPVSLRRPDRPRPVPRRQAGNRVGCAHAELSRARLDAPGNRSHDIGAPRRAVWSGGGTGRPGGLGAVKRDLGAMTPEIKFAPATASRGRGTWLRAGEGRRRSCSPGRKSARARGSSASAELS